jgi:hypothetical protein
MLEFKLQLVPFCFRPPGKLKLELQRRQSEHRLWLRQRWISKELFSSPLMWRTRSRWKFPGAEPVQVWNVAA